MMRLTNRRALTISLLITCTGPMTAQTHEMPYRGLNDLCYAETRKIGSSDDPPSIYPCRRALLSQEPQSREHRSANHYNLALILKTLGQRDEALWHFQRAVDLTNATDRRHLALAQLAQQVGEFALARDHYRLLLGLARPDHLGLTDQQWQIVERNYHSITLSLTGG